MIKYQVDLTKNMLINALEPTSAFFDVLFSRSDPQNLGL